MRLKQSPKRMVTFYHLTQPIKYKESDIFERFVSVLTALCILGLKVLELFLDVFMSVGKAIVRLDQSYG